MPKMEPNRQVLRTEAVSTALKNILTTSIHPNFAGYLCLKRTARLAGKTSGLLPNFKAFFEEFLRVADGTAEAPYIAPFLINGSIESDIWFNSNVAGSYAPSSIREKSPMFELCTIEKVDKKSLYSLKADFASTARTRLLKLKKIDALSLAIFLYRDYSFKTEFPFDNKLATLDLVDCFRNEFGFRENNPAEKTEFDNLFDRSPAGNLINQNLFLNFIESHDDA